MENVLMDEAKKNIKIVGEWASCVDFLVPRPTLPNCSASVNFLMWFSDFGLSNVCKIGEFLKTQCGSPEYAAPELFKKDCKYGAEVDLWSL
jgi:serine/threonine protein kinase